jgi:putative oxygen-independent coproporphyrinogen III oxidase
VNRNGNSFAVYVHWPFCAAKCPYCDFNSHVRRGPFDEAGFVQAYVNEIKATAARMSARTVDSVFFGGGTPSLMDPASVGAILDAIAACWAVDKKAEITLEANPTSVEAERFAGFAAAGVNRLSLGVQSLRAEPLAALGRLHTVNEAVRALKLAQAVFARTSFDLIYARPHQTLDDWHYELTEALSLTDGHISLYQLTIEAGTRYFDLLQTGKLDMPHPDLSADMFELTQQLCADTGLPAYEISNHARPGQQSTHNLVYWTYGQYAGIGPGAHGRLLVDGARCATAAIKNPAQWAAQVAELGHGLQTDEPLQPGEAGDEYLLMGLRLKTGISPKRFEALSGRALQPDQVDELIATGFVEILADGNLRVTEQGWPVLDAVVADLAA